MDCQEFHKRLDSYAVLSEQQLEELNNHAAMCGECRAELEFFRTMLDAVSDLPCPESPADLLDKVNNRIDALPNDRWSRVVYHIGTNARKYAAVAACLAVGLVVGLNSDHIGKQLSGDTDGVIDSRVTSVSGTPVPVYSEPYKAVAPTPGTSPAAEASQTPATEKEAPVQTKDPVAESVPVPTPKAARAPRQTAAPGVSASTVISPPRTAPPIHTISPPASIKSNPNHDVVKTEAPVIQTIAPALPSEQNASAEVNVEASTSEPEPEKTASADNVDNQYAMSRIVSQDQAYYIPEPTEEAEPTDEPNNGVAGEEYMLADEAPVEETSPTIVTAPDRLMIDAKDVDVVLEVMGYLNVISSGNLYTTTRANFYNLLSELDARGIVYDYIPESSTADIISFRLAAF